MKYSFIVSSLFKILRNNYKSFLFSIRLNANIYRPSDIEVVINILEKYVIMRFGSLFLKFWVDVYDNVNNSSECKVDHSFQFQKKKTFTENVSILQK